ncbi:ankyrin repeat domain-containing protein SOWAHA [Strongylocentrotus purpuratus]|uniref:SOWAHA-C winged helix-turn-helix domain-containing protein n=1 Tax=Strongylocentrotus purpuratus TaxID=7668 RepID=A0A7M7SU60_STRPU|nr:ankyrin repeat domain-containing protein SOWAHA [Strongylocentrotus purpuratus]
MADAEEEFSADAVQKFLVSNGGKATNVEVVGHFSKYLNDPEFKVLNRQKFKDYINEVATVKSEKGEKFLVLKNEFFYREWIEPKHVIIRSAQSQAPKPSWPPPAPEQPMETEPVAPARRKKKSRDHSSAHQNESSGNGRSSPKPKGGTSPRPTISAPIYTGPVDQHSVVNTRAGEKMTEELSQIEGVRDARDKFEQESRLQTPTPPKSSSSPSSASATTTTTPATTATSATGDAEAAPQPDDIPPAPVEIQITDEDKKEEEEHIGMESSERMEQEPSKEPTPPPPSMPPAPSISQAVSEMQKPEGSPSVQRARKLFEREAEKEAVSAAQLTPKLGGNRTPKTAKKLVQNGVSPAHHHDDEEHNMIGSDSSISDSNEDLTHEVHQDLTESVSSDTLRSIKSTSSGNSYPDTPAKLEPLERQWMLESAKGNVPVLIGLLDQEPGLATKKVGALPQEKKHRTNCMNDFEALL